MINNTFKYTFLYIKIKIKNEINHIIIMNKKGNRKHTKKKLCGYLQSFKVEFI